MQTYIDRSGEKFEAPAHLNFVAKIGDVILLDGLHQLITGFGIYDNQMWTEKVYEDGCHLGAGDYEKTLNALLITEETARSRVIAEYKKATRENHSMFFDLLSHIPIEQHLAQFA